MVLYSGGIWDLFVPTASFLSNHPDAEGAETSFGGTLKSRWVDANSRWGTRPTQDLSTANG